MRRQRPAPTLGTRKSDTNTTRDHRRGEQGGVPLVVLVPPLARDIPHPRLEEASWTPSLEVPPLVVLVSLLLPPKCQEATKWEVFVGGIKED